MVVEKEVDYVFELYRFRLLCLEFYVQFSDANLRLSRV